jgi:hypothetical protein
METKQKTFTTRTRKAIVRQRQAGKTITAIAKQWFAAGKGDNRVRRVLAGAGLNKKRPPRGGRLVLGAGALASLGLAVTLGAASEMRFRLGARFNQQRPRKIHARPRLATRNLDRKVRQGNFASL